MTAFPAQQWNTFSEMSRLTFSFWCNTDYYDFFPFSLKIHYTVKIYKCKIAGLYRRFYSNLTFNKKTTCSTFIADKSPSVFENIEDCDLNH